MKRVFVCEYLSGGGRIGDDPAVSADLLPAGLAMRDAIVADLLRLPAGVVSAVSVASSPGVPAPPAPAASVRARAGETPLDFVVREAQRHDGVWLVAPETGGLLAQFSRAVDTSRWLGCAPAAIELATSKQATLQRLDAAGVLTPIAFRHDALLRHWVVKPDDGAGAVETQVFMDLSAARDETARRRRAGETVTLEPWVDGETLSASLLCRRSGAELLSVNRQHIVVDATGQVRYDGVNVAVVPLDDPRHAAIEAVITRAVQAMPGLRGFVGIDLVWHAEQGPVVIEINPRLTCAYVGLSAALGRNLAGELLTAFAEDAVHATA